MIVCAISGSLQATSGNSAVLRAVADAAPDAIEVRVWDGLAEVPVFSPDVADDSLPPVVLGLRDALAAADLILVATPEYGGGMPGSLKNAFDWMVGVGGFDTKRVFVVSAAPSEARGANARRWVEETTRTQGATVLDSFTVGVRNGVGLEEAAARILERIVTLT